MRVFFFCACGRVGESVVVSAYNVYVSRRTSRVSLHACTLTPNMICVHIHLYIRENSIEVCLSFRSAVFKLFHSVLSFTVVALLNFRLFIT